MSAADLDRVSSEIERRQLPPPVQFLSYIACAGCAALVNFAAGSILVNGFGWKSAVLFPLAVAIAYLFGMAVNFQLSRRFTFASDRACLAQARTFIVVALSGLVLTTAAAAALRSGWEWSLGAGGTGLFEVRLFAAHLFKVHLFEVHWATPETISRVLAISLTSIYSFAAHKYFTFDRGIREPLWQFVSSLQLGGSRGLN